MPYRLRSVAVCVTFVILGCSSDTPQPKPAPQSSTPPPALLPAKQLAAAPAATTNPAPTTETVPGDPEVAKLFKRLDELGRNKVRDAKFVTFKLQNVERPEHEFSKTGWLITEDQKTVTVLEDDLIPWTYSKDAAFKLPSSWDAGNFRLQSVEPADFAALIQKQMARESATDDVMHRDLSGPHPSQRLLQAHAAWKRGLPDFELVVAGDLLYQRDKAKYPAAVLDDLAWLHFLRGVNLLMFADRREVLPHLRLVSQLSKQVEFAATADNLVKHLERMVAEAPAKEVDEEQLTEEQKADLYLSQLKDVHCAQMSQPGNIMPYMGMYQGQFELNLPTRKLRECRMAGVPALIKALDDDTPTRTVYHWRDFHRNRVVWRVSDFAWFILRDLSKREFGNRNSVGFTYSMMTPEQKAFVVQEIKQWQANPAKLSRDDQMLASFSSYNPEDWKTAAKYFLKKKDPRAVEPILKLIPTARSFSKGELCELVAQFGDERAKDTIRNVMNDAKEGHEPADRIQAVIALWSLGDKSGLPLAIDFLNLADQPYGDWEEPIWFLMHSHTPEGIAALQKMVVEGPVGRAGEVLRTIEKSITGDLRGRRRPSAACVEICSVLIAAMSRTELSGSSYNDVKLRFKDEAANAFAILRQGWTDPEPSRFQRVDPTLFNQVEPDEKKRDEQIRALIAWYEENQTKLVWDEKAHKLRVSSDSTK